MEITLSGVHQYVRITDNFQVFLSFIFLCLTIHDLFLCIYHGHIGIRKVQKRAREAWEKMLLDHDSIAAKLESRWKLLEYQAELLKKREDQFHVEEHRRILEKERVNVILSNPDSLNICMTCHPFFWNYSKCITSVFCFRTGLRSQS